MPQHWLVKSEPHVYAIDDLRRDGQTCWDGVRNYQARNFLRDAMRVGDRVLFYHSGAEPPDVTGVAGVAKVVRAGYPDATALDPRQDHHDPKSTHAEPIWYAVDLAFEEKFERVVPLGELKARPELAGMPLLQRGQRLSVMPIDKKHFDAVIKLAQAGTKKVKR
jgi:predicted RNA-binding protein with PUA-like domain